MGLNVSMASPGIEALALHLTLREGPTRSSDQALRTGILFNSEARPERCWRGLSTRAAVGRKQRSSNLLTLVGCPAAGGHAPVQALRGPAETTGNAAAGWLRVPAYNALIEVSRHDGAPRLFGGIGLSEMGVIRLAVQRFVIVIHFAYVQCWRGSTRRSSHWQPIPPS